MTHSRIIMLQTLMFACLLIRPCFGQGQENPGPVKNLMIMIPSGTSTSLLSLARWYRGYNSNEPVWLNVDGLITGLVKTCNSDAPIGDSAPTGSAYATGVASQAGYVATYPEKTPNDVVPVDSSFANTPVMTILEAAKLKGMSTGLAVTGRFSDATPASFSAHSYTGTRSDWIVPQMVFNHIDVVFGSGSYFLVPGYRQYLSQSGWKVIVDTYQQFQSFSGNKVWGLFGENTMAYDIDRDSASMPSLAEMTRKAIEILSKNEKGFFLMVEGGRIDEAAQLNDAAGMVTEFIAFDRAVKEALDFAKRDGNTAVVICPSFGSGAISMGNEASTATYTNLTTQQLLGPLAACKNTAEGFAAKLIKADFDETNVRKLFAENMGIDNLTAPDMLEIQAAVNRKNAGSLQNMITRIMKAQTFIGFTTGGHTGEDVFLACYHPKGDVLKGMVANTDVNRYMCRLLGINNLPDSTGKYFAGHKTVFPTSQYTLTRNKNETVPSITIRSRKSKKSLVVNAFENKAVLSSPGRRKQQVRLATVIVYVDKNEEFYLPRDLKKLLD
ncbi:MAG: alkaline phosphatase [Bacteroidales bacterium]|nr:alkaline phosphatase [Bacteroidales bacterium]